MHILVKKSNLRASKATLNLHFMFELYKCPIPTIPGMVGLQIQGAITVYFAQNLSYEEIL